MQTDMAISVNNQVKSSDLTGLSSNCCTRSTLELVSNTEIHNERLQNFPNLHFRRYYGLEQLAAGLKPKTIAIHNVIVMYRIHYFNQNDGIFFNQYVYAN
jgi:hypothetical protein